MSKLYAQALLLSIATMSFLIPRQIYSTGKYLPREAFTLSIARMPLSFIHGDEGRSLFGEAGWMKEEPPWL